MNPLGLYLGAVALNNVHAVSEMGRNASPADEKSKGMWGDGGSTYMSAWRDSRGEECKTSMRC